MKSIGTRFVGIVIASLALGCATGTGSWEKALAEDTPGAYHRFLREYPNSVESDEARERLAFTRLRAKPTAAGYTAFRKKYPDSALLPELRPIVEEEVFLWTRSRGTTAAYAEFLGEFPDGRFAERAMGNAEYLEHNGFDGRPTELGAFAARRPGSDFATEAQRSAAAANIARTNAMRRVGIVVQIAPGTPGADRLKRAFIERTARHYRSISVELVSLQSAGDPRVAQVDAILTIRHSEVDVKAELSVGKSTTPGVLATTNLTLARRGDAEPIATEEFRHKAGISEKSDERSVVFGVTGKRYWDEFFLPIATFSTQLTARPPHAIRKSGVAVAMDAHRAVVLYEEGSFDVFDVSDPAQPQVTSRYRRPSDLSKWSGLRLIGSRVAIYGENGIELIDLGSGEPKKALTLDRAKVGGVVAVERAGQEFLVVGSRGILLVTPGNAEPKLLVEKNVIGAALRGNRLVFVDAENLFVASFEHLLRQTAEGQMRIAKGFGVERLRVAGNYAIAFGERGVMVIDVSNPMQPRMRNRVNSLAAGEIRDAIVLNGRIYVLGSRGLQVLDGSASRLSQSVDVAARDRLAAAGRHIVMIGDERLQVVDTTPFGPSHVPARRR